MGVMMLVEAKREAPVRTEPHPELRPTCAGPSRVNLPLIAPDLVQRFGVDSRRTWWPFRAGTRYRACDSKIGAGRKAIRSCESGQICTLCGFGFVVPEASPG